MFTPRDKVVSCNNLVLLRCKTLNRSLISSRGALQLFLSRAIPSFKFHSILTTLTYVFVRFLRCLLENW